MTNSATYDYNVYFNGPSFRTGANDLVGVNPRLVNLAHDATADLSLSNVSPAINLGSNTTGQYSLTDILGVARQVGAKPDRGAYEFTGTVGTLPSFSQGNIAVLRVGDGSTTVGSNAAPATILEYLPNGT